MNIVPVAMAEASYKDRYIVSLSELRETGKIVPFPGSRRIAPPSPIDPEKQARIDRLREAIGQGQAARSYGVVPFGAQGIDSALPWGGLPRGRLHALAGPFGDGTVFGVGSALAGRLAGAEGIVLWCRPRHGAGLADAPYGPGLARFGLPPDRLFLVETRRPVDALWAMEEGLRCPDMAAVIGEGLSPDLTATRRLQLAAESRGVTALLLSAGGAAPVRSAAVTAWWAEGTVEPGARWRLALQRCQGGAPGEWKVSWDDETLSFRLAAPLADRPVPATRAG
ncbi:hypothetical protein [Inquilinus sp. CAU 1745]|uniref:ImuA family protein n=1 Tax=Inquilinus sp. CAU 1745 TaxID=3140369 RepID=UPI00325B6936